MIFQPASLHRTQRRLPGPGVASSHSILSVPSVLLHSVFSVLIPSFSFELRFLTLRPNPLTRSHD
jgi:hypothetical protein